MKNKGKKWKYELSESQDKQREALRIIGSSPLPYTPLSHTNIANMIFLLFRAL